jgi:hypothetical protein
MYSMFFFIWLMWCCPKSLTYAGLPKGADLQKAT